MRLRTMSVGLSRYRSGRRFGMEYPLKPHWLIASSLGNCSRYLGCCTRCSALVVRVVPSYRIFSCLLAFDFDLVCCLLSTVIGCVLFFGRWCVLVRVGMYLV